MHVSYTSEYQLLWTFAPCRYLYGLVAHAKYFHQIDGGVFRALVANGYAHLARNKDELNKINVFPIPDADTGNNMKIALRGGTLNQVRTFTCATLTA